jgi:hypothetical protein
MRQLRSGSLLHVYIMAFNDSVFQNDWAKELFLLHGPELSQIHQFFE